VIAIDSTWSVGAALVGGGALLMLAAGAVKVADPTRTAGALAARGWPVSGLVVRAGALAEVVVGAAVLVVGGYVPPALMAVSYFGFAWFVAGALRAGTPVGTCGCFDQPDTPPSPLHVVVDAAFALAAAAGAAVGLEPPRDASVLVIAGAVGVALGGYLVLTRW
jgi:hypothetical protein